MNDKNQLDKARWFCQDCKKTKSVRTNSYFYNSKIELLVNLRLLKGTVYHNEQQVTSYEEKVNFKTLAKWERVVSEAFAYHVEITKQPIGGVDEEGNGKPCEVNESLFFKRKYNRNRVREQLWYFGGVKRGTCNIFVEEVGRRDAETLGEVISQNIRLCTLIISDDWRAYDSFLRENPAYHHLTVNRSYNFVSSVDPSVHTQNIEGFWSVAKKEMLKRTKINKTNSIS